MHSFMGYKIPVDLIQKTGAGPDTFDTLSALHMKMLAERAPVDPGHNVLELGCGIGRDAIPLTEILSSGSSYVGIDIDRRSIDWCSENITSRHPNFRFHYFDVRNKTYNPSGKISTSDVRLPASDESIDRVLAQSVFTHLLEADALHYFRELNRVLAPKGLVLATFFVATESDMESSLASTAPFFRFPYACGDGFYVSDLEQPEGAVAVTPEKLQWLIERAGLELARPIELGYWLESRSDTLDFGQDVVLLSRRR